MYPTLNRLCRVVKRFIMPNEYFHVFIFDFAFAFDSIRTKNIFHWFVCAMNSWGLMSCLVPSPFYFVHGSRWPTGELLLRTLLELILAAAAVAVDKNNYRYINFAFFSRKFLLLLGALPFLLRLYSTVCTIVWIQIKTWCLRNMDEEKQKKKQKKNCEETKL